MPFNPTPKFGNSVANATTLACPYCGGDHLHQGAVIVRQRDGEDAPATVVRAGNGKVEVTRAQDAPGRRDSLDIEFTCENCKKNPVLRIKQHKGNELIEWLAEPITLNTQGSVLNDPGAVVGP